MSFRTGKRPPREAGSPVAVETVGNRYRIVDEMEQARMRKVFKKTREVRLPETLPGVGFIPATVIAHEVGDVRRFPRAENPASYAGTTPRVHASGGKVRYGRRRRDVNRYLKWAFVEAGKSVARNRERRPERRVVRLCERTAKESGRSKASEELHAAKTAKR